MGVSKEGHGVFQLHGAAPTPKQVLIHGSPTQALTIYGHFAPKSNPRPVRRGRQNKPNDSLAGFYPAQKRSETPFRPDLDVRGEIR